MDPVAVALLGREDDVRNRLVEAVMERGRSRTGLTFNVTNVLIDFETQTATVDDELDPDVAAMVPLSEFRAYLRTPPTALDAEVLMSTPLHWTPADFPWLRAEHDGQAIFMRLNTGFPDEALYSLLVDVGATVDLDDLPHSWTRGPLDWAETGRG